jgi:hypothetical protein
VCVFYFLLGGIPSANMIECYNKTTCCGCIWVSVYVVGRFESLKLYLSTTPLISRISSVLFLQAQLSFLFCVLLHTVHYTTSIAVFVSPSPLFKYTTNEGTVSALAAGDDPCPPCTALHCPALPCLVLGQDKSSFRVVPTLL